MSQLSENRSFEASDEQWSDDEDEDEPLPLNYPAVIIVHGSTAKFKIDQGGVGKLQLFDLPRGSTLECVYNLVDAPGGKFVDR